MEEYECKQVPVILQIPDNAIKLVVIATVMEDDGSTVEVQDTVMPGRLAEARIDGQEWEFENCMYCLTDKGKERLEELKNGK